MAYLSMGAVWADAVFVAGLQCRDEPSADQVRQAVGAAIRAFGCSGCAGRVTQEFGDHPETAMVRMRWARGVAREAAGDPPPGPGPRGAVGGLLAIHGDSEGAALEMERHLRVLLYMWRLALPGGQGLRARR